jgi:hypothetical protein
MGTRRARPLMSSGARAVSVVLVGIRKETTPVRISHEVLLGVASDKIALRAKQVGRGTPCAPSRIASQPVCAGRITKTRHSFVLTLQGKCFLDHRTQGVALGCPVIALSARQNRVASTCAGSVMISVKVH